jgi:PqqD family protein of HPr-rel-A system
MAGTIFIADVEGCRSVELEGLTLLFHPRSGMTHILAPPSPQILDLLKDAPADAEALLERLSERFDLPPDEAAGAVAARLAELEASGLVRRA